MGADNGGTGGHVPPPVRNSGDVPAEIATLKENCLNIYEKFKFSNVSQIKWAKSEEKSEFNG